MYCMQFAAMPQIKHSKYHEHRCLHIWRQCRRSSTVCTTNITVCMFGGNAANQAQHVPRTSLFVCLAAMPQTKHRMYHEHYCLHVWRQCSKSGTACTMHIIGCTFGGNAAEQWRTSSKTHINMEVIGDSAAKKFGTMQAMI